jgi:replicative DNA helicase
MPSIDLANRMLRVGSGVNLDKLKDQVASKREVENVRATLAKLETTQIFTDHRHNNVNSLSSLARQWHRKHNIKLLTIDYLQLLAPVNSRSSPVEALAHNTATIKQLALELNIPILLLCQLTYEARRRIIEKPQVGLFDTDLIGGSSTSNDADNVFLWWPGGGRPNESREIDGAGRQYMKMKGVFGKARNGVRDEPFEFKFIEQNGRFK